MASFSLDDLLTLEPSKISRDLTGYITYIYGSPKIGKAQPVDTEIPTPDGIKKLGDIKPGDYVFDRKGKPTKVLDVFPQGVLDCYKVILEDGRETICNDEHLWSYYTSKGNLATKTLREMVDKGILDKSGSSKYRIPVNHPVKYSEKSFDIDPYVLGCFLGDGCCKERILTISSSDEELVKEISTLIGAKSYKRNCEKNYSWKFELPEKEKSSNGCTDKIYYQTEEYFSHLKDYVIQKAENKHIPKEYLEGSIEQRYHLLQGLFDIDGSIVLSDFSVIFTNTSLSLMKDVQKLLNSLGYKSSLKEDTRENKYTNKCYFIKVNIPNEEKYKLFRLSRKKDIALKAKEIHKKRDYTKISIKKVEKLDCQKEMVCLLVDNEEHLYLTNDYIVTHNTTFARDMGALILECEAGTNALSGAYGMKMQNWADIRAIMRYCKDDKFKERYKAIALDTVDVAATLCEKYICGQNDVDALGKLPFGQGWTLFKKEFEEVFRTITMQGYAVLFISHDKIKTITKIDNSTYDKIVPTVSESINNIVKNMSDLIAYCYQDAADNERYMILRSLDGTVEAGSRFKYIEPKIPFGYTHLVEALNRAIDEEAKHSGMDAVSSEKRKAQETKELDFDELMSTFNNLIANIPGSEDIQKTTPEGQHFADYWQPRISEIISKYLGAGKKVSQCTRSQVEPLSLIVDEISEMVKA